MIDLRKIELLFERANRQFLRENGYLLANRVAERTLCGRLMLCLHEQMRSDPAYNGYYADVEYNRNRADEENMRKAIYVERERREQTFAGRLLNLVHPVTEADVIPINCDLIVHSRGENVVQDNLLAIEMKKDYRRDSGDADRERLRAMTRDSYDGVWRYDGRTLPPYICRYVLGVYYEIDYRKNRILIEYYHCGRMINKYYLNFGGNRVNI